MASVLELMAVVDLFSGFCKLMGGLQVERDEEAVAWLRLDPVEMP